MLTDTAKELIAKLLNDGVSYPVQAPDQLLTFTGQTLLGKYEDDLSQNYYNYPNFLTDDQASLSDPLATNTPVVAIFIYANKKLVVVNEANNAVILVFDNETDTFLYRVRGHRTYNNPDTDLLYPVLKVKFNEKTGDMYGLCEKNGATHFFLIADFWSQYAGETDRTDVFYNILFDVESEVKPEDPDDDDEIPRFNAQFGLFRTDPDLISDFSVDFFDNLTFAFTWWNAKDTIWVVRFATDLGQASPKEALWLANQKAVNPTLDVSSTSEWNSISSLAIMTGDTYVDEDNTLVGSILVSTSKDQDTLNRVSISGYNRTLSPVVYQKDLTYKTYTFDFHDGKSMFKTSDIRGKPFSLEPHKLAIGLADMEDRDCSLGINPLLCDLINVISDPNVTIDNLDFNIAAYHNKDKNTAAGIFQMTSFTDFRDMFLEQLGNGTWLIQNNDPVFFTWNVYLQNFATSTDPKESHIVMWENYNLYKTTVEGSAGSGKDDTKVSYVIDAKHSNIAWYNADKNLDVWDNGWGIGYLYSGYENADEQTFASLFGSLQQNRPFGTIDNNTVYQPYTGSGYIDSGYGLPSNMFGYISDSDVSSAYYSVDSRDFPTTSPFVYTSALNSVDKPKVAEPVEDTRLDWSPNTSGQYDDAMRSSTATYHWITDEKAPLVFDKDLDFAQSAGYNTTFGDWLDTFSFSFLLEFDTTFTINLKFSGYRETLTVNDATTIQYVLNSNNDEPGLKMEQVQILNDAYDAKDPVFVSPTQLYVGLKQKNQQDEYGLYFFSGKNNLGSSATTTTSYEVYEANAVTSKQYNLVSLDSINHVYINGVEHTDWTLYDNLIQINNIPANSYLIIEYESYYVKPQVLSTFSSNNFSDIVMKGVNNFAELGTNDVSVVGTGLTSASIWQPFLLWRDNDDLTYLNRVSQDVVQTAFTPPGTNLASAFLWRDDNLLNWSVLFQDINFTKLDWQATYANNLNDPYPLTPYFDAQKDLFINVTNFRKTLDFTGSTGQHSDVFAKRILDVATSGPHTLAVSNVATVQLNAHDYTHNITLTGVTGQPLIYWNHQQLNKQPFELLQLNFSTKVFFLSDENVANISQEDTTFDYTLDFTLGGQTSNSVLANQTVTTDDREHTYRFRHLTRAAQHVARWFNPTTGVVQPGTFTVELTDAAGVTTSTDATPYFSFAGPNALTFRYEVDGTANYATVGVRFVPTGEDLCVVALEAGKKCVLEGRILVYGDESELPDPVRKELAFT